MRRNQFWSKARWRTWSRSATTGSSLPAQPRGERHGVGFRDPTSNTGPGTLSGLREARAAAHAAVMATTFGSPRDGNDRFPKTSVYVGPAAAPIRSPVSGSKQPLRGRPPGWFRRARTLPFEVTACTSTGLEVARFGRSRRACRGRAGGGADVREAELLEKEARTMNPSVSSPTSLRCAHNCPWGMIEEGSPPARKEV